MPVPEARPGQIAPEIKASALGDPCLTRILAEGVRIIKIESPVTAKIFVGAEVRTIEMKRDSGVCILPKSGGGTLNIKEIGPITTLGFSHKEPAYRALGLALIRHKEGCPKMMAVRSRNEEVLIDLEETHFSAGYRGLYSLPSEATSTIGLVSLLPEELLLAAKERGVAYLEKYFKTGLWVEVMALPGKLLVDLVGYRGLAEGVLYPMQNYRESNRAILEQLLSQGKLSPVFVANFEI